MDWTGYGSNEAGRLVLGGCDAVELAREYGTPLYVMDQARMEKVCRAYTRALQEYPGGGRIYYAGKAFLNTAMCRFIEKEGLGLDAVSGGELYTAMRAGFPPERVHLHGNNKTREEIELGLRCGIDQFIVDSLEEIDFLSEICARRGEKARVSLRLNPGSRIFQAQRF